MMQQEGVRETFDLRRYLTILRTRKWWVIVGVVLGVVVALSLSARQAPIYQATARLLVRSDPITGILPNAENEAELVTSTEVAILVNEELALEQSPRATLSGLEAAPVSETSDVIAITYSSGDPEFARSAANQFGRSYLEYKLRQVTEALRSEERRIGRKIESVRETIRELTAKIEAARRQGNTSKITALESERATESARLAILLQDLDDLVIGPSIELGVGLLLEPAATPSSPASPVHSTNGLVGAILGLLVGTGLAFLAERLDDRFRGRPDVERALESPVLATVPRYLVAKGRSSGLPAVEDPRGVASEAYRNLRTGLQFITAQREIVSILMTSPSAHEGKTSTTANLGITLSQTGRRVIVMSADLRRPQLESYFGAESSEGLSTWLLGEQDNLAQLILEHPGLPNLSLLPAGEIPSNPAELLTSPRLPILLDRLEAMYDMVLIDSPPVLPVADSVILASHLSAVILIVDAKTTSRSAAVHAKEQLERVGAGIIGVVLNAFDPSTTPYYYEPYYYSQYYGARDSQTESEGPGGEVYDLHVDQRR